jgi:hypothetical protein
MATVVGEDGGCQHGWAAWQDGGGGADATIWRVAPSISADFFRNLGIPAPDENLTVGSASHAIQTARIMDAHGAGAVPAQPRLVVVYGDVNSALASAIVAAQLGIRIAHVEAGLRSHDRSMPGEINRIVTLFNSLAIASASGYAQRTGATGDHVAVTLHALVQVATKPDTRQRPAGWDSHAGERVAAALAVRP